MKMIDQDLINRVDLAINTTGVYLSKGDISELLANYISLIEQNAELHKGLASAKKVNKDMHLQVGGYLLGEDLKHWNDFNKERFSL